MPCYSSQVCTERKTFIMSLVFLLNMADPKREGNKGVRIPTRKAQVFVHVCFLRNAGIHPHLEVIGRPSAICDDD